MRYFINKLSVSLMLIFCVTSSFAINVRVQSTNKDISALGFTVNGKNHGGMGSSYSASGMPTGKYTFGIRVGGVFSGKDVPCPLANGGNAVTLNTDTSATLDYNGQRCVLRIR